MKRSHPFFASAVRCEVVNRDFDAFSFLQLSEDVDQQLEVEGVRVVEVILVLSRQLLLFFIQHLNTTAEMNKQVSKQGLGLKIIII